MMSRKMHALFALSLLLNVLVIGVVVGAVIRWQRGDVGRWVAAQQIARLRSAADILQPQHRRAYREALQEARRDAAPLAATSRAARLQAVRLFTAPVLDEAGLRAALIRARGADFAFRAQLEAAIIDVSATLPPEERRRLGEALRRSGPFQQPPGQRIRALAD